MPGQKYNLNNSYPTCNPGEFRNIITLLQPVTTVGVAGSETAYQAGSPATTAHARIEYLRGSEQIRSGIDISQQYLKITAWYDPAFTVQSRIQTEGGSVYIIQNVENVREMSVFMVLWCIGLGVNN